MTEEMAPPYREPGEIARTRWEYWTDCHTPTEDSYAFDRLLNKLGEDGWELVSACYNPTCGNYRFFMKRMLP